jgi:hypothetical protein
MHHGGEVRGRSGAEQSGESLFAYGVEGEGEFGGVARAEAAVEGRGCQANS